MKYSWICLKTEIKALTFMKKKTAEEIFERIKEVYTKTLEKTIKNLEEKLK